MSPNDQEYWKNKTAKAQAKTREVRERLSSLKKAYERLDKTLKTQTSLYDAMPTGILVMQGGKVAYINKTARKELGYTPEDCQGKSAFDFIHPEALPYVKKIHKNRLAGRPAPYTYETTFINRAGEGFECDIQVKKIAFKGHPAFLILFSPLESRKKKEREIIQDKKMEALMTMASGLNRQIGRNLQSIVGHISRIKRVCPTDNPPLREGLIGIEEAVYWISKTTKALEILSRGQDDQSKTRVFSLNDTVQEVLDVIEPRLGRRESGAGQEFRLETFLRAPSLIKGNPDEIRDVLVHTILNAMDAMPKGGIIFLSTEENSGYAHIYIQDSGVGIAKRINGRILDPFFTTKGEKGTGLGLSLAHAVVKRHQGTIDVKSKKNQGTIVIIRLPVTKRESRPRNDAAKCRVKDAKILIVEPQDMLRELLAQCLWSKGYRTLKAVHAWEGLRVLQKRPIDILIADESLSDMKAENLVKSVRRIDRDLPIIIVGARRPKAGPEHYAAMNVDLVLNQPLNLTHFLQYVSDTLALKGMPPGGPSA